MDGGLNRDYINQVKKIFPEWEPDENREKELLVEVWVHDFDKNDENYCDNWGCHYKQVPGWDDKLKEDLQKAKESGDEEKIVSLKEKMYDERWPYCLPVSVLKNLKEGETISCQFKGVNVALKANQLGARYRGFGRFENLLDRLVGIYNANR